jgi:hypothetical protein
VGIRAAVSGIGRKTEPRLEPVFVASGISIRLLMKMPGTQALRRAGTD